MSQITRERDTLRAELTAFAPSGGFWFGVFYRWAPVHVAHLTGTDWELLACTTQHDLAQAIADLYGAIEAEGRRVDTILMQI